MPEISRFYGIVIAMYFNDHEPPHFHVRYQCYRAVFNINTLGLITGTLPPRIQAMVVWWAGLYKEQLIDNWELCKNEQTPKHIPPLQR